MKKLIIGLGVVVVLIIIFVAMRGPKEEPMPVTPTPTPTTPATSTQPVAEGPTTVLGKSVEGRDITAYNFGDGEQKILLVGGMHGGYSWNTSLVAYEAMDYFQKNPTVIPDNVQVTIIPVANPDGLAKVVSTTGPFKASDIKASQAVQVSGRFNANTVDLNRNFDCDWQTTGTWQSRSVSGGSKPFSEPESMAIKNYVEMHDPAAVVVWYSAAGGVYASSCNSAITAETTNILNVFGRASGYPTHMSFDFYETTGDMGNWLAKVNIPAISVLLTNHTSTEWTKNKDGIDALLKYYAE